MQQMGSGVQQTEGAVQVGKNRTQIGGIEHEQRTSGESRVPRAACGAQGVWESSLLNLHVASPRKHVTAFLIRGREQDCISVVGSGSCSQRGASWPPKYLTCQLTCLDTLAARYLETKGTYTHDLMLQFSQANLNVFNRIF